MDCFFNGNLTFREAGSIGGQMVKNVCPTRTQNYVRNNRILAGHVQAVQYIDSITV
ncbi:MAG: small, acid-soluble spore protein, alpha/beta type [Candidatus Ventricola sp.]